MSFRSFRFAFIVLNLNVLCLSEKPTNCSCINWLHGSKFHFPSFLPKDEENRMKRAVCCITNFCLRKTNSSLLQNQTRCKQDPPINVTFPFISKDPSPNITFKRLPRPVLAMNINDASSSTANHVLKALGQIWKLFAFCLMAAALSGIIIWFLDRKANSGHFPKSFRSGIREGLWWAIVTMTTTGYGDRTPKSTLARAYASLWMVIGLLLMSVITAQISSTITADDLQRLDDLFGMKVGIPLGSKSFFRKYNLRAESLTEYSTERELLESLKNETEDKVWLFECEQKVSSNSILIVNTLDDEECVYVELGVKIEMPREGNQDNQDGNALKECMRWGNNKRDLHLGGGPNVTTQSQGLLGQDDKILEEAKCWKTPVNMGESLDNGKYEMDVGSKDCFENHNRGKTRQKIKWTTGKEMEFVNYVLYGLAGLLLGLLIFGALWKTILKARNGRKPPVSSVDLEKGAAPSGHEMETTNELHLNEITVN